jgi:hypothetical protein
MRSEHMTICTVRCDHDGCDAVYRSGSMRSFAWKQAKSLGWLRRHKADWCPKHHPPKKAKRKRDIAALLNGGAA